MLTIRDRIAVWSRKALFLAGPAAIAALILGSPPLLDMIDGRRRDGAATPEASYLPATCMASVKWRRISPAEAGKDSRASADERLCRDDETPDLFFWEVRNLGDTEVTVHYTYVAFREKIPAMIILGPRDSAQVVFRHPTSPAVLVSRIR